ncbi:hypothetical protein Dimus_036094 [Dionaea muscipula]
MWAIEQLGGPDQATPKDILRLMNPPNVTRERWQVISRSAAMLDQYYVMQQPQEEELPAGRELMVMDVEQPTNTDDEINELIASLCMPIETQVNNANGARNQNQWTLTPCMKLLIGYNFLSIMGVTYSFIL